VEERRGRAVKVVVGLARNVDVGDIEKSALRTVHQ
jgi:hypothetical protein